MAIFRWHRSKLLMMQMSVSNLFFAVVGLSSIVLTVLLVINETSRVHRQIGRRPAAQPVGSAAAFVVVSDDHDRPSGQLPASSDQRASEMKRSFGYADHGENNLATSWTRLREKQKSRGWKILPGNVVVHEGDLKVNPHDFNYTLNPGRSFCAGLEANGKAVLVFVESEAKNGDRRRTIRETWALPMLQKAMNFRVIFGLALPRRNDDAAIMNEFYAYGDVIQENFTESFKHLGLKSVMGLKWAQEFCSAADYVIKTDDDVLVHVPNLVKILVDEQNKSNLLLCHLNKNRQIVRHGVAMLKYRVSPGELPGVFFPSYCGGFGYVMSRDVVVQLYEASLKTPYFFIEDVYVTGFCRHKTGVVARDHPAIALKPHVTADRAPCDFAEGRVTSQELDVEQMKEVWTTLNTRGFFCPVPVAVIK